MYKNLDLKELPEKANGNVREFEIVTDYASTIEDVEELSSAGLEDLITFKSMEVKAIDQSKKKFHLKIYIS